MHMISWFCFILLILQCTSNGPGCCNINPLLPNATQPKLPSITLQRIVTTTTTTTTRILSCPTSFIYNSTLGKCYFLTSTTMIWTEGNSTCTGLGGRMAMPKTADERAFVASLVPDGRTEAFVII